MTHAEMVGDRALLWINFMLLVNYQPTFQSQIHARNFLEDPPQTRNICMHNCVRREPDIAPYEKVTC